MIWHELAVAAGYFPLGIRPDGNCPRFSHFVPGGGMLKDSTLSDEAIVVDNGHQVGSRLANCPRAELLPAIFSV
jgi:hypothetical protein